MNVGFYMRKAKLKITIVTKNIAFFSYIYYHNKSFLKTFLIF